MEYTLKDYQENAVKANISDSFSWRSFYNQFLYHPEDIPFKFSETPQVFTVFRKKLFSLEFPIVTLNLFFIPYTSRLLTIIPFSSSFFLNFLAEILHLSKFNNKKFADTYCM